MDPRRPTSAPWRASLAASTVVLAVSLGPVACRPLADSAGPAGPHREVVELEPADRTVDAAGVLDRVASARTGRTSLLDAVHLPPVGTADAEPPPGSEPVMTTRVEGEFDRDAGVVQGRTTIEAHEGSEAFVGELPDAFSDGGVAFELYADHGAPLLARVVRGHVLGGPVPSPWRDIDAVRDIADLDELLHGADDLLALLQEAVEAAPPEPAGAGRWRGSIPPEVMAAHGSTSGPLAVVATLAMGLPAEVIGGAIRYELSDLDGRVRVVVWLDANDMVVRQGEEPGRAPLFRCVVEWLELDHPVELWQVDAAVVPSP